MRVESIGVEAHPFLVRIARAKLCYRSDPEAYLHLARRVLHAARRTKGSTQGHPPLVRKCYDDDQLLRLDALRRATEAARDDSPAWWLVWLTLVAILRPCSHAGTAQWQYILPTKSKSRVREAFSAFENIGGVVYEDMCELGERASGPFARVIQGDARTCAGVPAGWADLVVTSPPYPNNYDYADATRLEMCFFGEIHCWGDLQDAVRRYLIRACSQHVPPRSVDLDSILESEALAPIRPEIGAVCRRLAEIRLTKGGKKTYHLMIATYFLDLAHVWHALRRACASSARICFVIGDSAPYGVYVPAIEWLSTLARHAGFQQCAFEKTRARNVKWKNRKHRVPLCEGRLWVTG